MPAIINQETCTGCGICVEVCPVTAIKLETKAKVDEGTCTDCGACVDECPVTAIAMQ